MPSHVITTSKKNGTIDPQKSNRWSIKAYASYGFERIFCAYKHNERLRNVNEIPEGRIEGANSINTPASQSRRQERSRT